MQPNEKSRLSVYGVLILVIGLLLYVEIQTLGPGLVRLLLALFGILPPFIIAIILAFLLDPLVTRLQASGTPRVVASLTVFLIAILLLATVGTYLVPKIIAQVTQFISDVPTYYKRTGDFIQHLMTSHKPLLMRLHVPTTVPEAMERYSGQLQSLGQTSVGILTGLLGQVVTKTIWLFWLILIALITLTLLQDLDKIKAKALYMLPDAHRDRIVGIAADIGGVFTRYLRGLVIVCAIYAVVAVGVFSGFGLHFALILGLVAGLLYAIPYVGPIGTAVMVSLAWLLQSPGHPYIALVLIGVTVAMNQIFDMLITPRVVGGAVGLHPALSIFALMFFGAAFGIVGMVLAIPLAASIQVVLCEFFPKLRKPLVEFESRLPKPPRSERKRGKRTRARGTAAS